MCKLFVIPSFEKILHDIFWQFFEYWEFVFRINHILKNLILKILRIYFYFMDYYNIFQKKELKSGVTELILSQEGQI